MQIGYWDENAYAKEYPESGALAIPLEAAPKDESDLFAEALLGSIACDPVPVDVTTFKQPVVYKDGKPAQSVTATSLTPLVSPTSASQPDPVALISQTAMKPIVLSEKGKKKTVTAKGKAGAQIAKWHERQEELAKTEPENNALEPLDLSDEALLKRIPSVETLNGHYEDLNMIACLLCERQFKSLEDLKKHQAKSNLHKVLSLLQYIVCQFCLTEVSHRRTWTRSRKRKSKSFEQHSKRTINPTSTGTEP